MNCQGYIWVNESNKQTYMGIKCFERKLSLVKNNIHHCVRYLVYWKMEVIFQNIYTRSCTWYHFQNRYLNFFKGRIDLPPQLICYGLTDESSVYYWLNFFVFILFWWNVVKLYYTFAVLHFHEVSSSFEKQKSFFNSLSTHFR